MTIPPPSAVTVITEDNWNCEVRKAIISYLNKHGIDWIFYKVMPCSALDRKLYDAKETEAKNIDKIESYQNADFMSQMNRSALFTTPSVQGATPTKKTESRMAQSDSSATSPVQSTDIKWQKRPPHLHGYNSAQAALYDLLSVWAQENYATTVDSVDPAEADRGSMLLQELTDVILPVDEESAAEAEERYLVHRFSLTDDSDIMGWWTQLLKLQSLKRALGVDKSARIDALKHAELTIKQKTCGNTFSEFVRW